MNIGTVIVCEPFLVVKFVSRYERPVENQRYLCSALVHQYAHRLFSVDKILDYHPRCSTRQRVDVGARDCFVTTETNYKKYV